jgi:hypothetical protein
MGIHSTRSTRYKPCDISSDEESSSDDEQNISVIERIQPSTNRFTMTPAKLTIPQALPRDWDSSLIKNSTITSTPPTSKNTSPKMRPTNTTTIEKSVENWKHHKSEALLKNTDDTILAESVDASDNELAESIDASGNALLDMIQTKLTAQSSTSVTISEPPPPSSVQRPASHFTASPVKCLPSLSSPKATTFLSTLESPQNRETPNATPMKDFAFSYTNNNNNNNSNNDSDAYSSLLSTVIAGQQEMLKDLIAQNHQQHQQQQHYMQKKQKELEDMLFKQYQKQVE